MRQEQIMLERIQRMMWIPNFRGLVLMSNPVRARLLFDAAKATANFEKLPGGSFFLSSTWTLINSSLNSSVEFKSASDHRDFSSRFAGATYTNAWVDDFADDHLLKHVAYRVRHAGNYEGWVGVVPTGKDE